jgi:hypothetical protein
VVNEKHRRLLDLPQHSDQTPATWHSYEEFRTCEPAADTRWWVRSLAEDPAERYRTRQGPWSPEEVGDFFAKNVGRGENGFVIQEYLEPLIAGATISTGGLLLSEGLAGAAAPLLREGATGATLASFGLETWRCGSSELVDSDALMRAHSSIPRGSDAVWEWIVTPGARVCHVDRKPLLGPYFRELPISGPPARWELGGSVGDHDPRRVELPDTSIKGLESLAEPCTLVIVSGSPLAHLCLEAVNRGFQVVLSGPAAHPEG